MGEVRRVYVEKKKDYAVKAKELHASLKQYLGLDVESVRVLVRYDIENLSDVSYEKALVTVFSEPPVDDVYEETLPLADGEVSFSVEFLPGQFDQRADSAQQCVKLLDEDEDALIKSATTYVVKGDLTDEQLEAVKEYCINPVDSREASAEKPETLVMDFEEPADVKILDGFKDMEEDKFKELYDSLNLAMTFKDFLHIQNYYKGEENRDPSMTEIRVLDTYWSDHCRHTTFSTELTNIGFQDGFYRAPLEEAYYSYMDDFEEMYKDRDDKYVCLMDMALMAMKRLKKDGVLDNMEESDEINACSIVVPVEIDGKEEEWLISFKNETHNHPTEIEPFGGAATCLGGAIRDPLSGRSYVYQAMRVTGAADPTVPLKDTLKGKLPQYKIVNEAANGYSSYGNQIGLATGLVDEVYHENYVAKRMEIGAVIAAAPAENVVREVPKAGDRVILLGGKTGRDGCGGATGSSKSHDASSLESCGAEVQKGNAPEERKLQRLFRNPDASKLIKRCNDFGAGGVSVAIGELADGLEIDLDKVPKKYEGLDGTELAISESQERMAVVVAEKDVEKFCALARGENLEATVVARVTAEPVLSMHWQGKNIVNISREFLNSNGAEKHVNVETSPLGDYGREVKGSFADNYSAMASDLNVCSKRGLSERFDSTIGAGTVLMPFGGKYQRTPIQAMVNKVSLEKGDTKTCSLMSWGYNPFITEKSPYHGAYLAVVESVCKLVAQGAAFDQVYLSFQEYFEKLGKDPKKWGNPLAALLGSLDAQLELGVGAIGGKDSMSGTFENIHVPPTLVSFAVTAENVDNIISPEFKEAGHDVYLIRPAKNDKGLPTGDSLKAVFDKVTALMRDGSAKACYTPAYGGVAEAILKMAMGNGIGFAYSGALSDEEIFGYDYGSFVIEMGEGSGCPGGDDCRGCDESGGKCESGGAGCSDNGADSFECILIGKTTADGKISKGGEAVDLGEICGIYEDKLEPVYPCNIKTGGEKPQNISCETKKTFAASVKTAKPRVLIPVFPGTNCEYDSAKAFAKAGAETEIFVLNNLTAADVARSISLFAEEVRKSQIIFIPGGFSGGDEPDGSGKLITAFFRNEEIKEAVTELLESRDGLMAGICNGFQALIKLGLVPFGKILTPDETSPTLTYNKISRHQSKLVRTRIASNNSPWLSQVKVGDVYTVPISHGEGRFIARPELLKELAENGQIITQYVDMNGEATNDIQFNPNGSDWAVEGIVSPDGRVLGKMGHSERIGYGLYKNVPGTFDMKMFESAVKYFK